MVSLLNSEQSNKSLPMIFFKFESYTFYVVPKEKKSESSFFRHMTKDIENRIASSFRKYFAVICIDTIE